MIYYAIATRPTYLSQADEIVVHLGGGRRPRAAVKSLQGEAQACLDSGGRLVRLLLRDSKILHLGQRFSGLPVVTQPPQPTPSGFIGYDLAARVATIFLFPTPDDAIAQHLARNATFDFDTNEHLLAVRLAAAGENNRRAADLYRSLAFLR